MKQGTGISASVGAMVSSLTAMACCLPLGFAAAIGAAGASAFVQKFRPWFVGLSVVLLGLGFWHSDARGNVKWRVLGQVLLWAAVAVVAGMILFPQQIAGFIADRLYGP